MQDERGAFRGREPVEHDRECELHLVVERDAIGGVGGKLRRERDDAVGQRAERRRLVAEARGADAIEAQPTHDYREPALYVCELVEVDAREPAERLLNDVFRFGGVTEHAPGEPEHPAAVLAPYDIEARVRARSGLQGGSFPIHDSSTPRLTVVLPISTRQRPRT